MRCGRRACAACRAIERNGVMPMPPAMNTAGREGSWCSVISPSGPSRPTRQPTGPEPSRRLNAVSRIRLATISSGSCGAEAIVKVRVGPKPSNSDGSSSDQVAYWPASNAKPSGRANQKAIVRSATTSRRRRRVSCAGTGSTSERPDAGEVARDLVALAGVVVPVQLAGLLALGELVRAVAERLVLRQAALAQPGFLAVDDDLRGLLRGALDDPGHCLLLVGIEQGYRL